MFASENDLSREKWLMMQSYSLTSKSLYLVWLIMLSQRSVPLVKRKDIYHSECAGSWLKLSDRSVGLHLKANKHFLNLSHGVHRLTCQLGCDKARLTAKYLEHHRTPATGHARDTTRGVQYWLINHTVKYPIGKHMLLITEAIIPGISTPLQFVRPAKHTAKTLLFAHILCSAYATSIDLWTPILRKRNKFV